MTEGSDLDVTLTPSGNCIMQSSVMKGMRASPDFCKARHVASSRSMMRVLSSLDILGVVPGAAIVVMKSRIEGDEVIYVYSASSNIYMYMYP